MKKLLAISAAVLLISASAYAAGNGSANGGSPGNNSGSGSSSETSTVDRPPVAEATPDLKMPNAPIGGSEAQAPVQSPNQ